MLLGPGIVIVIKLSVILVFPGTRCITILLIDPPYISKIVTNIVSVYVVK